MKYLRTYEGLFDFFKKKKEPEPDYSGVVQVKFLKKILHFLKIIDKDNYYQFNVRKDTPINNLLDNRAHEQKIKAYINKNKETFLFCWKGHKSARDRYFLTILNPDDNQILINFFNHIFDRKLKPSRNRQSFSFKDSDIENILFKLTPDEYDYVTIAKKYNL